LTDIVTDCGGRIVTAEQAISWQVSRIEAADDTCWCIVCVVHRRAQWCRQQFVIRTSTTAPYSASD